MAALMMPLTLLNLLGGIVSGIWLGILGEWSVIGIGLAIAMFGHWIISFALMPGMVLFGGPGSALANKGRNKVALLFGLLFSVYVMALITIWCMAILVIFTRMVAQTSKIPVVIWSYGVATGTWAYLSQKDQQGGGNEFSLIGVLFAEIAFIIVGILIIFGSTSIPQGFTIFGIIMGLAVIIQTTIAGSTLRKNNSV